MTSPSLADRPALNRCKGLNERLAGCGDPFLRDDLAMDGLNPVWRLPEALRPSLVLVSPAIGVSGF